MKQTLGGEIKSYWPIVLTIVAVIAGWTTITARLTQAENEIDKLSQVVTEINQINMALVKIDKDIEYIKIKIDK